MKSIASANSLEPVFEPYIANEYPIKLLNPNDVVLGDNIVVKTLINQAPINHYEKIISTFDKVVLLSRVRIREMAESLIGSLQLGARHNHNPEFKAWEQPYEYHNTDYKELERKIQFYRYQKKVLVEFSNNVNIPIDYYEDIYINRIGLHDKDIKLDEKYLNPSMKLRLN